LTDKFNLKVGEVDELQKQLEKVKSESKSYSDTFLNLTKEIGDLNKQIEELKHTQIDGTVKTDYTFGELIGMLWNLIKRIK
jgi:uncharacterized coiled-coil DUF342 family protein